MNVARKTPTSFILCYLLRSLPVVDAKDVLQIRGILRNQSRKAQPVTSLVREKLSSKPSPWQKVVASDTNLHQW